MSRSKKYTDILWNKKYLLAQQFFNKYGHLLISHDYMIDNVRLGRWIGTQRQNYIKNNNPFFTQEKIDRLNQIGMIWDVKEAQWEKMYLALKDYKEMYGNIRVAQSYITESGLKLGIWVNRQRLDYKDKLLPLERKKKLEELNMIWNPRVLVTEQWMINFRSLQDYINKYNAFPTCNYVSENHIKLGAWLSLQRIQYRKGKLLLNREKLLMDIGALRDFSMEKWDEYYEQAKVFYQKNGHLCLSRGDIQNQRLAIFLSRQRVLYKKHKLSLQKTKMLEDIGMVWSLKEDSWDRMYIRLVQFYKENGTLSISKEKSISKDYSLALWLETQRKLYRKNPNYHPLHVKKLESLGFVWNPYKSPDEVWDAWYQKAKDFYEKNLHLRPTKGPLRTWILAQRAARKGLRGRITSRQIALLEKIGMIWEFKKEHWDEMYEYAEEYYQIHELLNIPTNYVTLDGKRLGIWISRQRKVYREIVNGKTKINDIYRERIQRLNKIGMIWDASKIGTKTSFQEKAIFYYLQQFYPDIEKITQWEFIGYELDIYIPSIKVAIEYDGIWHKNSLERDNLKNKACLNHGIRLIRIREIGLPLVSWCKDIIWVQSEQEKDLEVALKQLFSLLNISFSGSISKDRESILQIYKDYSSQVFDRNYEKLYFLYQKYGALSSTVTCSHLDQEIKHLLSNLRSDYKKGLLTPLQIKKLRNIGFIFNFYEDKWQENYKEAVLYYQKYGDLRVPYSHITTNGFHLGAWISKQRSLSYHNQLDWNQQKRLDEISMDWRYHDTSREGTKKRRLLYLSRLKEYYTIHGNIDIKRNYVTKDGYLLGKWLERRRSEYRKGVLDGETISILNSLKMKWNVFEDKWFEMFAIAKEYYLEHGNIFISANYVTKDGIHLGAWISRQRKRYSTSYRRKPLTKEQIDLLNCLHIMWNPYYEKWMKNYNLAKEYYKKYGDLNIPVSYVTEDGVKLGMWLGVQRQANRGNPNYLMTPERRKLLDAIQMNWEIRHPRVNAKCRK